MTRKDLMYKSILRLYEIHGPKHFGFIPKTFVLPLEIEML